MEGIAQFIGVIQGDIGITQGLGLRFWGLRAATPLVENQMDRQRIYSGL